MTKFEKEQLIQLKTMEMNQLVNSSVNNAKAKTSLFGSFAAVSANKNNLARVKELRAEIDELKSMEDGD